MSVKTLYQCYCDTDVWTREHKRMCGMKHICHWDASKHEIMHSQTKKAEAECTCFRHGGGRPQECVLPPGEFIQHFIHI